MKRRSFIKTTAASSLTFSGLLRADTPNKKVNHAAVGCDGQGGSDLGNIASHPMVNVAALCDVDSNKLAAAGEKYPNARKYTDYREMLEKEGDQIDSVSVGIPDHMHAAVTMAALAKGKHVYCEKPLTHDVYECRQIKLAAAKAGVVTQMGNQIQSAIEYRSAVVMLQKGVIGKINEIHAWSGAQFPQKGRIPGEDPVPANLNWDQWIGTAPMRPYKNGIYHAFNWRAWQDFGTGGMGDFGCHILDTPFKAIELTAPTNIKASVPADWAANPAWNTENWPDGEKIEYSFPGTKYTTGDTIKVTWYDGNHRPERALAPFEKDDRQLPGGGSLFIGEGGVLLLPHVGGPQLVPYSKNKGVARPDLEPRDHYHSFIDAILGKDKTTSHFDYAANLSETVLLGNVANRVSGKDLAWDSAALKFTNNDDANGMLRRKYREGWEVAGL